MNRDHLDCTGPRVAPVWSERLVYRAGWWWGFASGLIVGTCTTGLLTLLVLTIKAALECPTC